MKIELKTLLSAGIAAFAVSLARIFHEAKIRGATSLS